MRNVVLATWVALGGSATGCKASTFQCTDDSSCVRARAAGTCEANGYCSFPDTACDSGRRYGDLSDEGFAGQCVSESGSTGQIAASSSGGLESTGTVTTGPPMLTQGADSSGTAVATAPTTGDITSSEDSGEPAPRQPNYAFITSQLGLAAGLGRDGSDALCNQLAQDSGLPGEYVAWLSDERVDAIDLLRGARGWVRTDGRPFADRPEDIAAGYIWHPLNVTETGETVRGRSVATGSTPEGTASDRHCMNWTSTDPDEDYWDGVSGFTFNNWTSFTIRDCDTPSHLYCFGVDQNMAVAPDPAFGRVAFLSTATMPGDAGVDVFDATCATEAAGAGLPGTYLAFVATADAAPLARFDTAGTPWVNTFGIPIISSTDDLTENEVFLLAPINASASGEPLVVNAWVGAPHPNEGPDDNCADWSDPADSGRRERSDATDNWLAGISTNCDAENAVLCFQE